MMRLFVDGVLLKPQAAHPYGSWGNAQCFCCESFVNLFGECYWCSAQDFAALVVKLYTAELGKAGPMALIEITEDNVEDAFNYHAWTEDQVKRGAEIRAALVEACKVILRNVPRCPLRTQALNGLFDARMRANAAITHERMGLDAD